jgi:hypothetical protein
MNTTQIALIVGTGIAVLAGAGIFLRNRHKAKKTLQRIEKKEKLLTEDEHKLKRKLNDKKKVLKEIREYLNNTDKDFKHLADLLGKVHRIIEDQEKLLHEATRVGKADLKYLEHIELKIAGKKVKSHVSEFAKHIEKHFGQKIDEPATARAVLSSIDHNTPDAILRGVKRLAFYLLRVHYNFQSLSTLLDAQKKVVKIMVTLALTMKGLVKKSDNKSVKLFHKSLNDFSEALMQLASSAVKEDEEYNIIFSNTDYVRTYLKQLEENETAQWVRKGPFFMVEGHDVDVVIDKRSNAMKTFGKGEKIDISYLPNKLVLCKNVHDKECYVVIGDGERLVLVKHSGGFHVMADKGSEDKISVKRGKKTLFMGKHMKLKDEDRLVFQAGYELRFMYE